MSILDYLKEEKKLNEIISILLCFIALLLFFSIISFTTDDYTSKAEQPGYVFGNWIGRLGASIDRVIFLIFGRSSYLLPILLIVFAVYQFKEKNVNDHLKVKVIALVLLIFAISGTFEFIIDLPSKKTNQLEEQLL